MNPATARWQLRRLWHGRWFGPWCLALAAGALWAAGTWYVRVDAAWQARLAAVPPPARVPAPQPLVDDRRQALQAFYAALPAQEDVPAVLQKLIDLAEAHRLQLLRGSYRLEAEPTAGFARYRMSLPLHGDPAQVQQFVAAALRSFPTLAIDSIQVKRDAERGRQLEARIQWVLHVRGGAAGAASRP